MKIQKSIAFILIPFLLACHSKTEEKIKVEEKCNKASAQIEDLNIRAAKDTNFRKSDEFRRKMESAYITKAKQESALQTTEKCLLEYELAINSLRKYTVRLKKNPDYRQDKNFMAAVENEASKVRDCYGILQKSNLTSEEKEKFEQLTHQKL
ncbi:MAG: hypothetical protein RIS29_3216 [Bacteroidota bacterium]|jgi:tRNA A37 N6-isopentenylltransferase MiaA